MSTNPPSPLREKGAHRGQRFCWGWRRGLARRFDRFAQVPVARLPKTGGFDMSDMTRGKRADIALDRQRSRYVAQLEEPARSFGVLSDGTSPLFMTALTSEAKTTPE